MIKLYIANLGKYNEGELVGDWIELPFDNEEFQDFLTEKVGINEQYEEYAIHDFECEFDEIQIGEYDSIKELNELAEWLDSASETEILVFRAILNDGYYSDYDDIIQQVEDENYTIYHGCFDMEDVARQYIEDCGILNGVPENLQNYFDYEAYGRDMGMSGNFIEIDDCYIELY